MVLFLINFLLLCEVLSNDNEESPIEDDIKIPPSKPEPKPTDPKTPSKEPNIKPQNPEEEFKSTLKKCSENRNFLIKYNNGKYDCISSFNFKYLDVISAKCVKETPVIDPKCEKNINYKEYYANASFSSFYPITDIYKIVLKLEDNKGQSVVVTKVNYINSKGELIFQDLIEGSILKDIKFEDQIFDIYLPRVNTNQEPSKKLKEFARNYIVPYKGTIKPIELW